jgi:hypothetical protein
MGDIMLFWFSGYPKHTCSVERMHQLARMEKSCDEVLSEVSEFKLSFFF